MAAWELLTPEQVAEVRGALSDEDRILILADCLNVTYPGPDGRNAIEVDFWYLNVMFSVEEGFSEEQTQAFLSVMKTVYERSVASHDGGPQLTARESFEVFKTDVMQHATATAAGEAALFDFPAVTRITEFATRTFYRHYRAYSLCYRTKRPMKTVQHELQKQALSEAKLVASSTCIYTMNTVTACKVAAAEFTNTAYARSGSIAQEKVNSIQARCVGVLHSDRCTSESDLNSKALIMLPACRLAAKHTFTSATRCTVTAQFAVRKVALFSTAQTDAAIPAPAATSRASPFKDAGLF
eukprot:17318-Heterococcus_DN1.PRE.1